MQNFYIELFRLYWKENEKKIKHMSVNSRWRHILYDVSLCSSMERNKSKKAYKKENI